MVPCWVAKKAVVMAVSSVGLRLKETHLAHCLVVTIYWVPNWARMTVQSLAHPMATTKVLRMVVDSVGLRLKETHSAHCWAEMNYWVPNWALMKVQSLDHPKASTKVLRMAEMTVQSSARLRALMKVPSSALKKGQRMASNVSFPSSLYLN